MMQDFHFRLPDPKFDPAHDITVVWRGHSPADAIVRFFATCLPDTRTLSPVLCKEDGVIYHTDVRDGYRWIQIVAPAVQFREGEVTLAELPEGI